jgi:NADPH:quinone reductase-like Zn-dependent oxidoreductase
MDFSGTVISSGSDVPDDRGLKQGCKVFGSIPVGQHVKMTSGALAEYVVVGHECVAVVPVARSNNGEDREVETRMKEMASLGIAGATALELVSKANIKRGQSVLVNGASGGIGHLVVQMCKSVVGESGIVVAVCSSSNRKWIEQLGVDEVSINYLALEHNCTKCC